MDAQLTDGRSAGTVRGRVEKVSAGVRRRTGWDYYPGRERPQGVRHAFSQHVSRLVNTV